MPLAIKHTKSVCLWLVLLLVSPIWGQSTESSVIVIEGGTLIDGTGGSPLPV